MQKAARRQTRISSARTMQEKTKNKNLPDRPNLLVRVLRYFPIRFILCGFFFAYVFLSNPQIQIFENHLVVGLFEFFHIPAYIDGNLVVGGPHDAVEFIIPTDTQVLFLIFFPTLAVATQAGLVPRVKILLFGMLCFIAFALAQFLIITFMTTLGLSSQMLFMQINIIVTGMIATGIITSTLFSIMKLPRRTKVNTVIKRSYLDQYAYLALMLAGSVLLIYLVTTIFNIQADSPVASYLSVNIITTLSFRYFISYFIYEIKMPRWAKSAMHNPMTVTFLLPAYNEEVHIKRSIESIDRAASRYSGNTEIIIVNDGSTDDTKKIASDAILNLRHASGKVFNIPNSGRGFALQYGLKRSTGDAIFRIDADSTIDKNAIEPIIRHFNDPSVGSVSGLILPLEEKNWIQKLWILQFYLLTFYRREWELIDSVLSQPGAFSVFRKDALVKAGGWVDHQLGEDGEITVRLGRCGYRNEYEQHAVAFSDVPTSLKDLREQRVRWSMAFYHARAANLDVIKESKGPMSSMYMLALLQRSAEFASALFLPFLLAQAITRHAFTANDMVSLFGISLGLITVEILYYGLHYTVNAYFLIKFKKLYLLKFIPMLRIYEMIHSTFIVPEAVEILLSTTSRWKEHSKELTVALRKKVREGV